MAAANFNAPDMPEDDGRLESLEEASLFEIIDDNLGGRLFEDRSEDIPDNIIFFDRRFLLIDGNDETIDLIITDDIASPTLGEMLANGTDGENCYAILDANGEHIPMVRDVEILVTPIDQENAAAVQKIMDWDDLKAHGIELNSGATAVTLTGWHLAGNSNAANLLGDSESCAFTTIYENGKGLKLETTLVNKSPAVDSGAAAGLESAGAMPIDQMEGHDLQTVIFLAQDGNC